MADTYDQSWPVSFADQKNYADYLLSRAKILYSRATPITVNKYLEPSQGEWENAYVTETGLPLPIPVGTKLYWRSYKSNRVLSYGTINDVSNGSASSGKVYNLLNMNYVQPSFRFLGYSEMGKQQWVNRSSVMTNYNIMLPSLVWLPSGTFLYGIQTNQIYYWMERGLESLYLIYRMRTADLIASPTPNLNLFFNQGLPGGATDSQDARYFTKVDNDTNNMESLQMQLFGDKTTAAGFGTPTLTADSNKVPLLGRQAASDSAANVFSYGHMWMHNVAQTLDLTVTPNAPKENYHTPTVYGAGSYVGATITEANTAINWGVMIKEDNGYTRWNYLDVGTAKPVTAGQPIHSGKLWVYGMFKNLTGEFRE